MKLKDCRPGQRVRLKADAGPFARGEIILIRMKDSPGGSVDCKHNTSSRHGALDGDTEVEEV